MYRYSTSQLAIITAVPTVTVLLIWTLAIFYKNKKQWRPYDICIVAILFQSVLRNLSTIAYTILTILNQTNDLSTDYCTGTIWLFNSIHTFQASTLSTLSVVGLYVIKLARKQKELKQYLTITHIAYHLFCLTTLCACVGVAAILARRDFRDFKSANFDFSYTKNVTYDSLENCQFMPYDLDVKYNIFILSLHALLAFVSVICFLGMLYQYYEYRRHKFEYLKKSTSDLSDLSLGCAASTVSQKEHKNYYDTYQKPQDSTYIVSSKQDTTYSHKEPWNSDQSNISTSVSSTNSRRPCLLNQTKKDTGAGMETIMPVLVVCYLFNHLPVVVICVFPWLPTPWTNGAGAALWLGLIQDALMPTALGLVDGRFNAWVSKTYRCSRRGRKTIQDKPPHGLDGKFRPFSNTGQTLEVPPIVNQIRTRPVVVNQIPQAITQTDHKFPITNGSLYTSIDGRLPIIHNYRRHKGLRSPVHSISMGLHSTYVKRQESILNHSPPNTTFPTLPEDSFISLPTDFTSIESTKSNLDLNHQHLKLCPTRQCQSRLKSTSQHSLSEISIIENELRKARMSNLSKSQNDINLIQRDIQKFRNNPEIYQKQNLPKLHSEKDESSDEEFYNNSLTDYKNYDTISSESCCSITTEANCDFEFYVQDNESKGTMNSFDLNDESITDDFSYFMCVNPNNNRASGNKLPVMRSFKPLMCQGLDKSPKSNEEFGKNFRIRRSNSKRSLDKLDTYIQSDSTKRAFDDLNLQNHKGTYVIRSNSNRTPSHLQQATPGGQIHRSCDYLHAFPADSNNTNVTKLNLKNLNTSCINFNHQDLVERNMKFEKPKVPVLSMESLSSALNQSEISYLDNGDICKHNYGGSVPDFKKIFVSEFL